MERIDPEVRSRMMAGIRGTNTRPEMQVRSFLHRKGFRFRIHVRQLPGSPDVVLPKWQVAIFVNGCFWHGHAECRYFKLPMTRREFWIDKIARNVQRDRKAMLALGETGWRVIVVWECALRDFPDASLAKLVSIIPSGRPIEEIHGVTGAT